MDPAIAEQNGSDSREQSASNSTFIFMGIYEYLKSIHTRYESIIPPKLWKDIEDTKEIVDNKCICISVLGQHNCGKSTFINALLGDEFLPVSATIETTVKVEVQHDHNVHQGVCLDGCSLQLCEGSRCPSLEVLDKGITVIGTQNILKHLKKINGNFKDYVESKVILKVHIPLLCDQVPRDWQLKLIDNPGFGDARQHVAQIASESLHTSSVYMYLLETGSIGGELAARFFIDLSNKDQGAIQDGRLMIGISKYDINFDNPEDDTVQEQVTEEHLKYNVIKSIDDAIKVEVSRNIIIPLCGRWGLAASKLSNSMVGIPGEEIVKKRLQAAQKMLERCPYVDLPGGQDQSLKDLILKLNANKVVTMLEQASGFGTLKDRLQSIGKSSVKVWLGKICSQFSSLLNVVSLKIEEERQKINEQYDQKEGEHQKSAKFLMMISEGKQALKAIANDECTEAKPILNRFEERYESDIKKSQAYKVEKEKMEVLFKKFKDECKEKVNMQKLDLSEFEMRLQEVLEDCESRLQQDTSFPSAYQYQSTLNEWITQKVELLNTTAREITSVRITESGIDNIMASFNQEVPRDQSNFQITRCGPDLKSVKAEVMSWLLLVTGDQELEVDVHRGLHSSRAPTLCDIRKETQIRSFSMKALQSIRKIVRSIRTRFPGSRILFTQEEKSQVVEPPSEQKINEWTPEFDEFVDGVMDLIEETYEEYYDEIKNDVVKHFFGQYSTKTKARLEKFDREFSEKLKETEAKLKQEIADLKNNIQALSECNEELKALQQNLIKTQ